jgi:repressor of nif and glnA expression
MDEKGFTRVFGKEGRKITQRGREELASAMVSSRVGFIISKIETLSFQTNFDMVRQEGDIIINVSFLAEEDLREALGVMRPVFSSPYVMSDRVILAGAGEKVGDLVVPNGKVALGTVCSVTVNGIFLKAGIPVTSRFGGLLQVDEEGPSRFVALISYEGSSLDPLVVFIKSRMTSVNDAVRHQAGKVLASFREIPVVSVEKAVELQERLKAIGIGGILLIGNPNQPIYEMPVSFDKAGMVIVGGLNPVAALEESGIPTDSAAMAALYSYTDLIPFKEALKKFGR